MTHHEPGGGRPGDDHDALQDAIRAQLHAQAGRSPVGGGLDAGAAIAGARRRRRPKVAIATGATAFAAVGILAIALPSALQPISMVSTTGGAPMSDQAELAPSESGSSIDQSGGAADSAIKRAPAERIALCESAFPFTGDDGSATSMSGLSLEVVIDPAVLVAGSETIATARLTNPTSASIEGRTTTAAAGIVGVDGVTRWHSPGGLGAVDRPFSLEPGASVDLPMTVAAVSCTVDDDLVALETGAFPADLAPLSPGPAVVVAALDVSVALPDAMMILDLVVSAPTGITITG